MISMNLSNIAILNIHGVNYRCIINGISRSEAVNLLQNTDLSDKKKSIIIKYNFYLSCINNLKDVNIDNILRSNQIFSSEKNYKYFIG